MPGAAEAAQQQQPTLGCPLATVTQVDVYEGLTSFVLVGHDRDQRRLLQVHRRRPEGDELPPVSEDACLYSVEGCRRRMSAIAIEQGAALSPEPLLRASALLGMIRFVEGYYMVFVSRHEVAGVIAGHAICRVEETAMLAVDGGQHAGGGDAEGGAAGGGGAAGRRSGGLLQRLSKSVGLGRWGENWVEAKYKALFQSMDMARDFYFSYTYDLTNTLQTNMSRHGAAEAEAAAAGGGGAAARAPHAPREQFVWNQHLCQPLLRQLHSSAWVPPVVHGFFLQSSASLFGRTLSVALVARRSRLYAGARLLKRGLTESGHVANEVEVEQIVCDGGRGALHEGSLTSAVQVCASQMRLSL